MAALSKKLRNAQGGRIHFWCPGCNEMHGIVVGANRWQWNGDAEKPTFTPSILVKGVRKTFDKNGKWYGFEVDDNGDPVPTICHSFVTDGNIRFLNDCTHELSGQTVPLPDWTGDD